MQVQGPRLARTLEKLVGPAIYDLKYYWCDEFEIGGIPVGDQPHGFTAAPGFEVNCLEFAHGDAICGRRCSRPERSSASAWPRRAWPSGSRPA